VNDENEEYTIRFTVNVHGWEEEIAVSVQAPDTYAACDILSKALTRLCAEKERAA
jgi:ribosome-associated translation inhibitor RaiA